MITFAKQERCCCYHKGRNFQANHNWCWMLSAATYVVVATTKVGIFKQITTSVHQRVHDVGCCCYHKGRNFQANHNYAGNHIRRIVVVVATTKVGIFKQITTDDFVSAHRLKVVVATTKVGIFKQITTECRYFVARSALLLLPQR